jgi:hypothetical protein
MENKVRKKPVRRSLAERLEIQKEKVAKLEAVTTFRKIGEYMHNIDLDIDARVSKIKALFVEEIIADYQNELDSQEVEN